MTGDPPSLGAAVAHSFDFASQVSGAREGEFAPGVTAALEQVPGSSPAALGTRCPTFGTRADAAAVLMIAGCALLLHWEGLLGGPAFYERDTRLFYYPLAHWVAEQFHAGVYPLWMPDIFAGYPIFADGELGLLYVPQVGLLAWLPTALAIVWLRALHAFMAGAFMHLFLRTQGLGPLASLGGALVFTFGSFLTAQMHHENLVRSAVWLPLVLALAERALQATGRRRWGWLALGALVYAQSALGLHVQPVLMLTLALSGYVAFRTVLGWPSPPPLARARPHFLWAGVVAVGTVGGGLALAAAQWIPLLEWARASFRRVGVSYEFASAFGLAPENLPTLLFPYFFRLPDGATWWSLWEQWETELYVGVPTLALALVGVLFSRRREVLFFLPLGAAALLVGMTHYAPIFNLHEALWSTPGFSFLRAPGRFSYLVVFTCAGLAALGLEALGDVVKYRRHKRLGLAIVGAAPATGLLALLLVLFPTWRGWLASNPERARVTLEQTYLAVRAQYPLDPGLVYGGLMASLDLANPKTWWSLALLGLTAGAFVTWLALGPRHTRIGQALFVTLVAADLLVFAADFHPRAPLDQLVPASPPGVPTGARVMFRDLTSVPGLEPNTLVASGLRTVEGYSSLPSQRHVDLHGQTLGQPELLDLWAAPYILDTRMPDDRREAEGVEFRLWAPLAAGFGSDRAAAFRIPPDVGSIQAVRIVGTLSYAFDVPQGVQVAEVSLADGGGIAAFWPLRAGVELAERAIDRPSLQPHLKHSKPPRSTAADFDESSPFGEDYQGHLYLAELSLREPLVLRPTHPSQQDVPSVSIRATHPRVLLQIHGIGIVRPDRSVHSVGFSARFGLRLVAEGPGTQVIENLGALPRAILRDMGAVQDRESRPDETPVSIMSGPGFDPRNHYLLEGVGPLSRSVHYSAPEGHWAPVEELGPNALRVRVDADRASYLVVHDFYHRGWLAWVDGKPAPIYIANAVFRAVPLEPGAHTVEMRFQPLSHLIGAGISAFSLLTALLVIGWSFTRATRAES
jgi:hypothetical protein